MSDEQQFTRYRVIITVTSAVRTPAGSDPAPLKRGQGRVREVPTRVQCLRPAQRATVSHQLSDAPSATAWGQGAAENETVAGGVLCSHSTGRVSPGARRSADTGVYPCGVR